MGKSILLDESYVSAVVETPKRKAASSYFSALIQQLFGEHRDASSVLFAGADPGCGVSYISSCVAAELAASGKKVLLADAAALLALVGRESAVERCERIECGTLWVLGKRQIEHGQPSRQSVFDSPAHLLESLRKEFPVVLVDAPALAVSDAALRLATLVDGAVLIADAGKTETRKMQAMQRRFTSLGAHVFGAIYNSR